ncbi:hypothetical protein M406DRAFT_76186 [Cryphonectria parasitica EP155]|uniref:Uncharacterized protein n=1 Tax=Cryphonectria parasitica (strain ATCC 38755 / EP155) TaxID=660469 RepID=A0A9P4Y4R4_CRYP1|nr:uncharacterized protein M406DRAFT_76186 [Cryphonectria parasitica EP155]KAF3766636.1 hypothetical protein M406DRAFT_76186 [Cryphonectria parasitica EP155]
MAMKDARRPIIFVSHDIGGLVVKAPLILAHYEERKHSDLLRSARTLSCFLGVLYPHRPLSDNDLEVRLFRLLALRPGSSEPGYSAPLVKSLRKTIIELNEAFIYKQMLTQTILMKVYSEHAETSQSVFREFTCLFGVDGELREPFDRPHLEFPVGTSTNHPLQDTTDSDWLGQTPPTYPILHTGYFVDGSEEIENLIKPTVWNHILYVICASRADLISQECFNTIDKTRDLWQFQFYFDFDSYDA